MRRQRRRVATALVIATVLGLAGAGTSCAGGDDTAHVVVSGGDDGGCPHQPIVVTPRNDVGVVIDDGEGPRLLGPDPDAALVGVPDVIGLSSREPTLGLKPRDSVSQKTLHVNRTPSASAS